MLLASKDERVCSAQAQTGSARASSGASSGSYAKSRRSSREVRPGIPKPSPEPDGRAGQRMVAGSHLAPKLLQLIPVPAPTTPNYVQEQIGGAHHYMCMVHSEIANGC